MMDTFLNNCKINTGLIKNDLKGTLVDLFGNFNGTKTIIWDNELAGLFGLITEYSYLKKIGVVQMYMLDSNGPIITDHVIYIMKSQMTGFKILVKNFNKVEAEKKSYHIIYVPSISYICQLYLTEKNISYYFKTTNEFPVYFFPFDSDLFSMENSSCFKEIYLEEDKTCIYDAACGIMEFQKLFGVIPTILGQGKNARLLCDILLKKRKEQENSMPKIVPQIDTLIIIDRSIDLVTPLLTQLNYEGIINELFGIRNNICKLPSSKFPKENESSNSNPKISINTSKDVKQFMLDSNDEVFCKIRDKYIKEVPKIIKQFTKSYKTQFDERHNLKSLTEYKSFVNKIPYLTNFKKSLANHLLITELIYELTKEDNFVEKIQLENNFLNLINTDKISPYIEDCIARNESYSKVIRLICLQSQTNNGLKSKVLDLYRKQIFQVYGFYCLLHIENLIKIGVLRTTNLYRKSYATLKKNMKLTFNMGDENNSNESSFVYAGYIPISVKFCQLLIASGLKLNPDIVKLLPDILFEENQELLPSLRKRNNSNTSINSTKLTEDPKLIFVLFIGGCTHAEVSSLRLLSQQETDVEFIVATTKLFNGNTFIDSLNELKL